jgi:A/G-specific adenine glycosylase
MIEESRRAIASWYHQNKRTLPWRESGDPYLIWLSEIILQQTRVEQGTPYYLAFSQRFKTVSELADAHQDEILKMWQGLGYYSRARNLHEAAKQVRDDFDGVFPKKYDDIIKLKGVGPYTAAAVASIAFGEAKAVVDGNVIRVIARIFGIEKAVNTTPIQKQIQHLADELLDVKNPGDFNQAMMEFGALFCTPKKPSCENCPLKRNCIAEQESMVGIIPMKEKKVKRRNRYFHFLIVKDAGQLLVEQRGPNDIWQGLFQFPLIETDADQELSINEIQLQLNVQVALQKVDVVKKHVLSHQDLYAKFYHLQADLKKVVNYKQISTNELHTFALPRLIDRYLESAVLDD